jgi:hypothetical protein
MRANVYVETETTELIIEEEAHTNPYVSFDSGEVITGTNERGGSHNTYTVDIVDE